MVLVMRTSWIPQGKESEVGKKYLEVMKKFPTDKSLEQPVLTLGVRSTKDGMKVVAISEVKKGNIDAALNLMYKRLLEISSSIEGFRYEIETLLTGPEAMSLIGLGMPE